MELRRANVLSDLFSFSVDEAAQNVELVLDSEEYEVDLTEVEQAVAAVATVDHEDKNLSFEWHEDEQTEQTAESEQIATSASAEPERKISLATSERLLPEVEITKLEDFDTCQISAMRRLYRKIIAGDSLVRIAFMGDSFIESDIITADMREALQNLYGGCGVGYAPMHSPHTLYRSTIKTDAKGWTSHNIMQHRKTPEPYNNLFTVAGWVSLPQQGATTTWHTTAVRENIDSCRVVRLHFLAHKNCRIEVSLNEGEPRSFSIKGGEALRQVVLRGEAIRSVSMRVAQGAEGFVGYGAHFEGESGVTIDNYSVRSNNGQAMFWSAPQINAQVDKAIGGYDLVVLQYGLNIMQSGVNKYTSYSAQVEKMIQYVRHCFPRAAVMVLGVSDRSIKHNGVYQPMSEAVALTEYQRDAARNQGVAFWDTYAAMQAQGGMTTFVANGWAAKDFTHINLKGGHQIACALVDAMVSEVDNERRYVIERVVYEPLVDSVAKEKIIEKLLPKEINMELPRVECSSDR